MYKLSPHSLHRLFPVLCVWLDFRPFFDTSLDQYSSFFFSFFLSLNCWLDFIGIPTSLVLTILVLSKEISSVLFLRESWDVGISISRKDFHFSRYLISSSFARYVFSSRCKCLVVVCTISLSVSVYYKIFLVLVEWFVRLYFTMKFFHRAYVFLPLVNRLSPRSYFCSAFISFMDPLHDFEVKTSWTVGNFLSKNFWEKCLEISWKILHGHKIWQSVSSTSSNPFSKGDW